MSFHEDLQTGVDDQLAEAGQAVSITRGGLTAAGIPALYVTPESLIDRGEAAIESDQSTFVIRSAEYAPQGVSTDPRVGDRITRHNGQVYEVATPSSGLQHFEDYGGIGYAFTVYARRILP